MALSAEQHTSLKNARDYVDSMVIFIIVTACIGALTLGISIANDSRGGIAFAIIAFLVTFWADRIRVGYRKEIVELQNLDAANDIIAQENAPIQQRIAVVEPRAERLAEQPVAEANASVVESTIK